MDLLDNINQLANRVERQKDHCATEEAAKTSFVLPFFKALGYDVFNPLEVQPEYVADVGVKKGEKVDYAISIKDRVQILVECKPIGAKLELEHASQLFRYYSVTEARFAVLTDGIKYCFYTDVDAPNKMDKKPFFVFDLLDFRKTEITELKKFTKEVFDIDAIMNAAADMKYQHALADEIRNEFSEPSEEFTRLLAGRVYDGRLTQNVAQKFSGFLKRAIANHIRETVDHRLKGALNVKEGEDTEMDPAPSEQDSGGIDTNLSEVEAHFVIKAIVAEVLDPERVHIRDGKSYCAILLDNNNRKPIVRLHFNNEKRLRVQIFDVADPEKVSIGRVADLFRFKLQILKAVAQHLRADIAKSREKSGAESSDENRLVPAASVNSTKIA